MRKLTEENKQRYQTIADQIQKGNTDDAIISLKEILSSKPDDLVALSMSGSAHMRAGDETEAFKYFEAAVKASPDSKFTSVETELTTTQRTRPRNRTLKE